MLHIRKHSNGLWSCQYTDPVTHRRRVIYGKTQEEILRKLREARLAP